MHHRLAIVFLAASSVCCGAEVGDIGRGSIQSQTKDELIVSTSPCTTDASPLKFQTPWKLKALGKKTCDESKKTYDEYEVEQLAAADDNRTVREVSPQRTPALRSQGNEATDAAVTLALTPGAAISAHQ
ncbi:MAG TPA: hypothetical protein VII95_15865 [Terriglobales bacterium]|jgi:hypothetical protein